MALNGGFYKERSPGRHGWKKKRRRRINDANGVKRRRILANYIGGIGQKQKKRKQSRR